MDAKKSGSFSRQMSFSSRLTVAGLGQWKRLLCLSILFISGLVCGHFIHSAIVSRRDIPRNLVAHRPAAYRAARGNVESSLGRPGLSIKKDLSIQYRDYIPRLIFINCGGTFPKTVKLFIDTYPNSHEFVIYSFIADESFSPLYEQFPNHKLFAPLACAASNGTKSIKMRRFASNITMNVTVPTFDVSSWIKDSTHPDEHLVLKIDAEPDIEKRIVARMMKVEVLEWIDQFYTTTHRIDVVEFEKKEFSARSQDVLFWDEYNGTYSDFLKLNPPKNPPPRSAVIKECGSSTKGYHPIFLYASKLSCALNSSLNVLTELRKAFPSKLPMALFLPYDFVISYPEQLESLLNVIDVGAYVYNIYPRWVNVTDEVHYFKLRNKLVAIENRFTQAKDLLQNVLVGNGGIDESLLTKLITERHYNMFVKTVDITDMRWMNFENLPKLQAIPDLQMFSIDISEPNSELLILYLFKQLGYKLLPLADCLK